MALDNTLAHGAGAAHSGTASPGSSLKDLALQSTQVICVAYTDKFSIDGQSLIDLQHGCKHGAVSSNQAVLKTARTGRLATVTAPSGPFPIRPPRAHPTAPALIWRKEGGSTFKYARAFTPITDVLLRSTVRPAWEATCDVHEVTKKPLNLFNSRLCGYGTWYMEALHSAFQHNVFPIRTAIGTRTVFA